MATDFFERQRLARQQSLWLRALFALALVLASVLVAVGFVLLLGTVGLGGVFSGRGHGVLAAAFVQGSGGWRIAGGVLLFSLAVSGITAWRLREGGPALARSLRGRMLHPETSDPAERQLLNIVSEMSLASQVQEPEVWLLDREDSINAFAAGRSIEGAVIGVTAGALQELDRDQMQAVIAHEFSHILNGDMALNTRLIAWLSGLFAIERFARALKRSEKKEPSTRAYLFWWVHLGFWFFHACGYIGLFIGRLLQAAICRRRERLADASAVQFTRNPAALKSALLKIEAAAGTGRIGARAAAGMAHMFFAPGDAGVGGWLASLQGAFLATHPTMAERVRALDSRLSETQYRAAVRHVRKDLLQARHKATAPVAIGGEMLKPVPRPGLAREVQDLLCSRLNHDQQQQVLQLTEEFAAAPEALQALFVGALLDGNAGRARAQLLELAPVLGAGIATRVVGALQKLRALEPAARLPLLSALLPALAKLPDRERLRMVKVARAFSEQIAPLDTLRFATSRLMQRSLVHPERKTTEVAEGDVAAAMDAHSAPIAVICSLVAQCSEGLGSKAYAAGLNGLIAPLRRPAYISSAIDGIAVDAALESLAMLPYMQRAAIGAALLRVIAANGTMSAAEFDLLRVVTTCIGVHTPATGSIRLEPAVPRSALPAAGGS
jgi:Zn-dependent protease with chaperone function